MKRSRNVIGRAQIAVNRGHTQTANGTSHSEADIDHNIAHHLCAAAEPLLLKVIKCDLSGCQ